MAGDRGTMEGGGQSNRFEGGRNECGTHIEGRMDGKKKIGKEGVI